MEFFALLIACTCMLLGSSSLSVCFLFFGSVPKSENFQIFIIPPKEFSAWKKVAFTGTCFIWDILKGWIAVSLLALHFQFSQVELIGTISAVIAGHCYLSWTGVRQNPTAVVLGVLLALHPVSGAIALLIFLLTLLPTGLPTLSMYAATFSLTIFVPFFVPTMAQKAFVVCLGLLCLAIQHKSLKAVLYDQIEPLFHWRLGLRQFPQNAKHCLFMTHIPGDGDAACKKSACYRFWWMKFMPKKIVGKLIRATPLWACYMGHSTGIETADGTPIICHVFGVPYEMSAFVDASHSDYKAAYQRLVRSIEYWVSRMPEVLVVGLGAGTGITHKNGLQLVKDLAESCPNLKVTNGNSFTAVAAVETSKRVYACFPGSIEPIYAVVGAGGSVGRQVVERLLKEKLCAKIMLVGNPASGDNALSTFIATLKGEYGSSISLEQAKLNEVLLQADTVFLCANVSDLAIDPKACKKGLKIIDVGKPANSSPKLKAERPDIILVAGGHVEVPGGGIGFGQTLGLFGRIVYACCAETLIHATGKTAMWRDGAKRDLYVGKPSGAQSDELQEIALELGFRVHHLFDPHTDKKIIS